MNSSTQVKVLAPVMTRDVVLPSASKKVQMVMVPVPDSSTMMAFPWSTITQLKQKPQQQQQEPKEILMMDDENQLDTDEVEARELLNWSDGIGTLNGCDLKFKVNQLGCLELLDSDDEAYDTPNQQQQMQLQRQQQQRQAHLKLQLQRQKFRKQTGKVKQVSSGVSLLRDGPLDPRRSKTPTYKSKTQSRTEVSDIVLGKLIPREKLHEFRNNAQSWTVDDVKNFIDSISGCSGLGSLFQSHEICGQSLLCLEQKDLLDINVKLGPAVKIQNAISLLKS